MQIKCEMRIKHETANTARTGRARRPSADTRPETQHDGHLHATQTASAGPRRRLDSAHHTARRSSRHAACTHSLRSRLALALAVCARWLGTRVLAAARAVLCSARARVRLVLGSSSVRPRLALGSVTWEVAVIVPKIPRRRRRPSWRTRRRWRKRRPEGAA